MKDFSFELEHKDSNSAARAGIIKTKKGDILTPVFMPVGTHGAIKALQPKELIELDIAIMLSNTCLLYTSPSPRDRTRYRMPSSA